MLPIRGLYEVAIPVLGLAVGLRDERQKWLFLRAGGAAGMVVLQERDGEFPSHHFAFTVDGPDLERAATVLREAGVDTRGPIFHGWMAGTSLYFEDLDGHELELFAPST